MRATVSAVIAAYNAEEFVAQAVTSALGQVDEVLVVDDGSADASGKRAAAAGARVIRTTNRGPAAARNRGIAEAQGQWVAFLDADDYWLPGAVAGRLREVQAEDIAVFGKTAFVDASGQKLWRSPWGMKGRPSWRDMFVEDRISTSSVMIRREALEEVGGFDESLSQGSDHDLYLRLLRRFPGQVLGVEQVDTRARRRVGQMTKNHRKLLEAWEELVAKMEKLEPEWVEDARAEARANILRVASVSAWECRAGGDAWRLLREGIALAPRYMLADTRTWKQLVAVGALRARQLPGELWRRRRHREEFPDRGPGAKAKTLG